MVKKISILLFLVILPEVLGWLYDRSFRYAGNWLENYQNFFKIGFIIVSVLGSAWLIVLSKSEKKYAWLALSIILFVVLLCYLVAGLAIIDGGFSSI